MNYELLIDNDPILVRSTVLKLRRNASCKNAFSLIVSADSAYAERLAAFWRTDLGCHDSYEKRRLSSSKLSF